MTELEQAIAAVTKATPGKAPWTVADFADDPDNAPEIDAHIATILNAIATRQLVPAQAWQPIETIPDCVEVLVWARGWESPSIGFASDGVGPYDPISGGEFDPWPTYWMPLPPPPAEGV